MKDEEVVITLPQNREASPNGGEKKKHNISATLVHLLA
jgi:hypothetical protein